MKDIRILTIEEQIQAAVAGDEGALLDLLQVAEVDLRGRIPTMISGQYRPYIEVDDVLQVTYHEAFLYIHRFEGTTTKQFLAWLSSIARNNIRDAIKALQAEKRPPIDKRDPYCVLMEDSGATVTSAGTQASRAEFRAMVDHALEQLPEDYEQALRLLFLEGLSAKEAQEHMNGPSTGAIYMMRQRALVALRQYLPSATRFFTYFEPAE